MGIVRDSAEIFGAHPENNSNRKTGAVRRYLLVLDPISTKISLQTKRFSKLSHIDILRGEIRYQQTRLGPVKRLDEVSTEVTSYDRDRPKLARGSGPENRR